MADFLGKTKGRLIIGGSTIPGGYLLPRWIGRFSERHPNVKIKLMVADTQIIIDGIINSTIEAGVVGARSDAKQIHQTELISDDLKVVVPGSHKWAGEKTIDIDALKTEPFIIREQGSGNLALFCRKAPEQGHDIDQFNVIAEMGSTEAVKQAIKGNMGISVLSSLAVADDVRNGQLKELALEGLDLRRHFYLTVHQQRSLSPLCTAFTAFLHDQIKAKES